MGKGTYSLCGVMSVHISLYTPWPTKSQGVRKSLPMEAGETGKVVDTGWGENWGQLCNPSRWGVHNFRPAEPTSLFPFLSFSVFLFLFVCFWLHFLLWLIESKHGRIQKKGDTHFFFNLKNLREGLFWWWWWSRGGCACLG